MTVQKWSTTAATNATADSTINWREGQAPSGVNNSGRAMMAAVAKWRDDLAGKTVTGGSSTSYTLTSNQTLTALTDGYCIGFELHADCGADPDLNVDSLGATDLKPWNGGTFQAGQLKQGGKYIATYDSSASAWVVSGMFAVSIASLGLSDPDDDQIIFWDDSAGALAFLDMGAGLAISGTDLVLAHLGLEDLTDPEADRIVFWDDSTGATAWLEATTGLQITGTTLTLDINGLTEDTLPSGADDFEVTYDTSAGTYKKVRLNRNGGRVFLNTLTASGSATLVDTASLTSAFSIYEIEFESIVPATGVNQFVMRFSDDGGSSYESAGYLASAFTSLSAGTTAIGAATAHIPISSSASSFDNTAGFGLNGVMRIYNPASASVVTMVRGQTVYYSATPAVVCADIAGAYTTAATINALQFLMTSGNIASGSIRIYGVMT